MDRAYGLKPFLNKRVGLYPYTFSPRNYKTLQVATALFLCYLQLCLKNHRNARLRLNRVVHLISTDRAVRNLLTEPHLPVSSTEMCGRHCAIKPYYISCTIFVNNPFRCGYVLCYLIIRVPDLCVSRHFSFFKISVKDNHDY